MADPLIIPWSNFEEDMSSFHLARLKDSNNKWLVHRPLSVSSPSSSMDEDSEDEHWPNQDDHWPDKNAHWPRPKPSPRPSPLAFTENGYKSAREKQEAFMWSWDANSISKQRAGFSDNNRDVIFHTGYSSGTEGVRGDTPLKAGCDHYWEIKILATPYGTDMMVGVGTKKVRLSRPEYCSALGTDLESWGLSYRGMLQHDHKWITNYGPVIKKDDIVGVHLNMWNGNLTFYINGRCLGIAFKLPTDKVVYPMACATAAFSRLKLIYSHSCRSSLQTLCLQSMDKDGDVMRQVRSIPGLSVLANRTILDKMVDIIPDSPEKKQDNDPKDKVGVGVASSAEHCQSGKRRKHDNNMSTLSFRERCDVRFSANVNGRVTKDVSSSVPNAIDSNTY